MLVQAGLCRTCPETTLLVFPRDGSFTCKGDFHVKPFSNTHSSWQLEVPISQKPIYFVQAQQCYSFLKDHTGLKTPKAWQTCKSLVRVRIFCMSTNRYAATSNASNVVSTFANRVFYVIGGFFLSYSTICQ